MSVIDQNLIKGEKVVYRTRLHKAVLFFQPGAVLFGTAVITFLLNDRVGLGVKETAVAGILLSVASSLLCLARYTSYEAVLTNRRVLTKSELLNTKCNEILFTKVEAIEVHQHLIAKVMGFGDVIITGSGGSKNTITSIPAPFAFRNRRQELVAASQAPRTQQLVAA